VKETSNFLLLWLSLPVSQQLVSLALFAVVFFLFLFALAIFLNALRPEVIQENEKMRIIFFAGFKKKKNSFQDDKDNCEDVEKIDDSCGPTPLAHRFFKYMAVYSSGQLKISDNLVPVTAKEAINLAFLRDCMFKIFYDGILEYTKKILTAPSDEEKEKLVQNIPLKIQELINVYNDKASQIPIQLPNGIIIKGVPLVYINKFNQWHDEHVALCLDNITYVLRDKMYTGWYDELRSCLDFLLLAFQLTEQDARKTLNSLNGELDKAIEEKIKEATRTIT